MNGGASSAAFGLTLAFACSASGCRSVPFEERAFCSSEGEAKALPLRIQLSDSTDGFGHPLAWTPWKIASGDEPEGLALIDAADTVAEGDTAADGLLELDAAQQRSLAHARCARRPLWLVYPGSKQAIEIRFDRRRRDRCDARAAPPTPLCLRYGTTP